MSSPVSKTYAKAIYQISHQSDFDIVEDFQSFFSTLKLSKDLERVLFNENFSINDKTVIADTVLEKLGLNKIFISFVKTLIKERRINLVDSIYKEVVMLDDAKKGFLTAEFEGPDSEIDKKVESKLLAYLEKELGKKISTKYKQNKSISAGYKVKVDGKLMDTTLENQLNNFKKTIQF